MKINSIGTKNVKLRDENTVHWVRIITDYTQYKGRLVNLIIGPSYYKFDEVSMPFALLLLFVC